MYAESLLERRNDKFIHRRGVINFELAKLFFDKEETPNYTLLYLNEAKDLFIVKQILDPFSSYSYSDYIKLLIWETENIEIDQDDDLQRLIIIEELLELATRLVTDDTNRIDRLTNQYSNFLKTVTDNVDYLDYLLEIYSTLRFRPYACILLYNYYQRESNLEKCQNYIEEMEDFTDNFEVVKFLFTQYGRQLHDPNTRIKFFKISNANYHKLEKDHPLRYNYFNFIAESYNYHYQEGRTFLQKFKVNIQNSIRNLGKSGKMLMEVK